MQNISNLSVHFFGIFAVPRCVRGQVNFFQGSAVAAWLGFAITFVARPLGGVVLGASARSRRFCRVGRYGKSWGNLGI